MKAFILTEGGSDIGFGHITRCSSLYQAFEEKGIVAEMIVNGDETTNDLLRGLKYRYLNWLEDCEELTHVVRGADAIVIDSYLAGRYLYQKMACLTSVAAYLDDNRRLDYPAGIVVNGGINAERCGYPELEGVEYLLGTKYILLRKAFWYDPGTEVRDNAGTIMVTFGGDDTANMTPKLMELLAKEFAASSRQIVIGKGYRNIGQIEAAADGNTILHYYPDAEAMRDIMTASDIVISAGGQTLYELARVGVPAIAVAVADNQMDNIRGWQDAGFIEYAGWCADKNVYDNISNSMKKMQDRNVRARMSASGTALVDGGGARRVAEEILCKI